MDYPNFPTLPQKQILQKWRDILVNDADIKAYCLGKYGKAPNFFVGLDVRDSPGEDICPLIVIFPGDKIEGLKQSAYNYTASVGWVILQEDFTISENLKEYHGIYEVDDIGQLILKAVMNANPDYPVTQVDFRIDLTEHQPQYAGHMDITMEISVTMGVDLVY